MKLLVHISVLLLFVVCLAHAQYYGERVQQKSFEQADFFFTPNFVNPFGVKGFSSSLVGVLDDPLLNLQINPGILPLDSATSNYVYVDFRTNRDIVDNNQYYGYRLAADERVGAYSDIYYPYPRFYANSRKSLEPLVSIAYLSRPLQSLTDNLFLGLTYQLILQDEKYYSIPQDIYKSAMGYDYAGVRTADGNGIPIIDKYSGTDNMHQTGHFASVYGGIRFNDDASFGLRLNRTVFDRDGGFGSRNFWESPYTTNYTSLWHNFESRFQNYRHWDAAAGFNLRLNENNSLGLSAGYLSGLAYQNLSRLDTSMYSSGQVNVGPSWYYSSRFASTLQSWDNSGKTRYATVHLRTSPNTARAFNLVYSYARQTADLLLGSVIGDSSRYAHRYQWDTSVYSGNSRYVLTDARTGTGTTIGTSHKAVGVFIWESTSGSKLHLGITVESKTTETKTVESVKANRFSTSNYSSNTNNSSYDNSADEEKTLLWDFKTSLTTIQIPVIFTHKASEVAELIIGLNRKMARWEIEDMTLALFKYRNTTDNSGTTNKTDFGERYTSPKETITDVQTSFLFGLNLSPSKSLTARILLTPTLVEIPYGPSRTEFQWWIGLSLYP